MKRKDQLPAGGCEQCGAHTGESQSVMRKTLTRINNSWLCSKCAAGE